MVDSTMMEVAVSHLGDEKLLQDDEGNAYVYDVYTGEIKGPYSGQSFVKWTAQNWMGYPEPRPFTDQSRVP